MNKAELIAKLVDLEWEDISLPRNPIIAKLFRMVKLAENAGFGFDKIETKWMEYNHTKPVYKLSFDSTIVDFFLGHTDKTNGQDSVKKMDGFSEVLEKIRNDLSGNRTAKEKIINTLFDNIEKLIPYLENNFGISSEHLRNTFGILSENYQEKREKYQKNPGEKITSDERKLLLLMLIAADNKINAEKAAEILSVSDRTIESYISYLKEYGIVDRIGSRKEGYWQIVKQDEK